MIPNQLQSIQVLRGVAALVVFYHHLSGNFSKTLNLTLPYQILNYGFCGVDLFFVISGFIIHKSAANYTVGLDSFFLYLKKRFKRVFPIYWTVIIPVILLSIIFLHKTEVLNLKEVFSIFFLTPGHNAINPVSWTLSYELYFYCIFSLILLDKRLISIPIFILLTSLVNLFTHTFGSGLLDKQVLYFYFSPFNFEFLIGVIISVLSNKIKIDKAFTFFLIFGIIVFILVLGPTILDDVTAQRVGVFIIPSTLLIICITNLETNYNFKFSNIFINLGNSSYSLYLIHFPIIILVTKIVSKLNLGILAIWILFMVLLITIPFSAYLFHKNIEKPIIKLIK